MVSIETGSVKDRAIALSPSIVLVAPQMGENIGAAARAMANFGLWDLRLVRPRDGWPNPKAGPLAAGALDGPVAVSVFNDVAEAMGEARFALATTARPRDLEKAVLGPREAIARARGAIAAGDGVAILFGAEQAGLETADLALADAILTLPVAPRFASLNLAQAVGVVAYEWAASAAAGPPDAFLRKGAAAATKRELDGLMSELETQLQTAGFFWPFERGEAMRANLRAAFARSRFTSHEVATLRGAVKALVDGPRRRAREALAREAQARGERRETGEE